VLLDLIKCASDCLLARLAGHGAAFGRLVDREALVIFVPNFDEAVGAEVVSVVAASADTLARGDTPIWLDVANDHRRHGAGPRRQRIKFNPLPPVPEIAGHADLYETA